MVVAIRRNNDRTDGDEFRLYARTSTTAVNMFNRVHDHRREYRNAQVIKDNAKKLNLCYNSQLKYKNGPCIIDLKLYGYGPCIKNVGFIGQIKQIYVGNLPPRRTVGHPIGKRLASGPVKIGFYQLSSVI